MKKYQANQKGFFNVLIIIFILLPVATFLIDQELFLAKPFLLFLPCLPFGLMLWIYLNTFYIIDNKKLYYRSGFIKGKIEINSIQEIKKGTTMWVGLKPALAKNGLILKYDKHQEIYIAPKNNDQLVNDLLEINHKIIVITVKPTTKSQSLP